MNSIGQRLIPHVNNDEKFHSLLKEAKQGHFWHWQRTYILKSVDHQIYAIRMNLFERIYAYFASDKLENFLKKTFSSKKIHSLLPQKEIDILIYKTARSILKTDAEKNLILGPIYERIENESKVWRGNRDINLKYGFPPLMGPQPRTQWWGGFAKLMRSDGLNFMLSQINLKANSEMPVALDLGCGNNEAMIYLLEKGWKVIGVDYSPEVLTKISQINQKWLETKQLILTCSSIEKYEWPQKVELVLAGSALPYCDPKQIKTTMASISACLKPEGYFVGNFFASKYTDKSKQDLFREMGAWFLKGEDDVGYMLAGQDFEVIQCEHGGKQHSSSVVFLAKKS